VRQAKGLVSPLDSKRAGLWARFAVLKGAARELWIVFVAKVLAILAYAVMNSTLVLWLSAGYSTLSVVDIRDLAALAQRLKRPAAEDRLSSYLASELTPATRDRLAAYQSGADPHLRKLLVQDLNRLIRGPNLYAPDRFTGVSLSGRTQALLDQPRLTPAQVAHFNRLLLEDAYPSALARPSPAGLAFSDAAAGSLIATWSTVMTLCTVLVGSLVDAIGLRKAFLLGFTVCLLSRGVMTFTTVRWLALGLGLFPLAVGEALLTPVMVAAVHRYSNTAQRSISFSIFYAMMNVGFAVAGLVFDAVRRGLGEYGGWEVAGLGLALGTYQTLFGVSFLLSLPGLLLMYFGLREGVEATDEGLKITPQTPNYTDQPLWRALCWTVADTFRETVRIFTGLWRQPAFYKFLAFLTLVVGVRLIFYHMNYTYPKFGIRELGEGAPIGSLWSLNQVLIIALVPLVGALTQKVSAYRMVTAGSAVAAAAVFLMALPPQWFAPLADGEPGRLLARALELKGTVHPYYMSILLFIVVLSVGEAFYSPRLYEYSAAIAPKGQEASYMAMSLLPFFVAKFIAGMFSGWLLAWYCPETGPRDSPKLWLVIALTASITPVGLVLLRPYIRVQEPGRTD
jgi:MFS family permease